MLDIDVKICAIIFTMQPKQKSVNILMCILESLQMTSINIFTTVQNCKNICPTFVNCIKGIVCKIAHDLTCKNVEIMEYDGPLSAMGGC